jgi:glycosyltransferase involved in cell wall biosynthesis
MPIGWSVFHVLVRVCKSVIAAAFLPIFAVFSLGMRGHQKRLIWGPVPIINNKYWSEAMQRAGWDSRTLMSSYYSAINKRSDFDVLYEDLLGSASLRGVTRGLGPLFAHLYVVRHARVMHIPFSGGPLAETALWRCEAWLYRLAGIRTVLLPYGADIYMYSKVVDSTVRNALLLSYPDAARRESDVECRVRYWTRNADVIVMGFTMDGIGRWDIPCGNMVCIDTEAWALARESHEVQLERPIRVLHAPNHRGAKGTEFILRAVEKLKTEGLDVELILAERISNDEVRRLMRDVDILADQLILPGYGLNAIEGMASGLPVIANLEDRSATGVFRRYSFLNECPIVSASPETFLDVLRTLVKNRALRQALERAGRVYVEKYHSYAAAQYLFGSIYRKFAGEDVDLMNLYHPDRSTYCRDKPVVSHPLVENKLPLNYCDDANAPR